MTIELEKRNASINLAFWLGTASVLLSQSLTEVADYLLTEDQPSALETFMSVNGDLNDVSDQMYVIEQPNGEHEIFNARGEAMDNYSVTTSYDFPLEQVALQEVFPNAVLGGITGYAVIDYICDSNPSNSCSGDEVSVVPLHKHYEYFSALAEVEADSAENSVIQRVYRSIESNNNDDCGPTPNCGPSGSNGPGNEGPNGMH